MKFDISSYLAGLLTALVVVYVRHLLTKSHTAETSKKNRQQVACDKYRSAILYILKGIYPDTSSWDWDINNKLTDGIPSVELAVTEFKHFITRKAGIEAALQRYKECCHETTDRKCATYIMYPKEGEIDPKEIFKTRVEDLLEFAKKP